MMNMSSIETHRSKFQNFARRGQSVFHFFQNQLFQRTIDETAYFLGAIVISWHEAIQRRRHGRDGKKMKNLVKYTSRLM